MKSSSNRTLLIVGSYADPEQSGVYVYELDKEQETLNRLDAVAGMKNPTFVGLDEARGLAYAISETTEGGERIGEIVPFRIDAETGKLTELTRIKTLKPSTSHIEIDHSGKYAAVSGYHGGNVGLIRLPGTDDAGQLTDEQQHEGQGADPVRQDRPHPHSAKFTPDNRFLLVADLGLDRVRSYAVDAGEDKLTPACDAVTPPGSGPRHLAFHPDGRHVYSINEVGNSITTYEYEAETGRLTPVNTVSSLPDSYTGENTTAEIAVSNDGRYLYGSNRGHDSIVQFAIDPASASLSFVQHVSTEGGHPRHFALTPDGDYLICANRDSNNLTLFRVDPASGKLTYTGHSVEVAKPVCVRPLRY